MNRHEAAQADALDRALNEPTGREDLHDLAALASELHRQLGPAPASMAVQARVERRVRNQLRAAHAPLRPRLSPALGLLRRAAIALLVVGLIAGATGGTALAASNAYPGDALYPIKLAEESLRLVLSPSEEGDAELLLSFAGARLQEATHLLTLGRDSLAVQTLGHYDESMAQFETLAPGLKDRTDLEPARHALGLQRKELQALMAGAPLSVMPALKQAEHRAGHAEESLLAATPAPPTEPPGQIEPGRENPTPHGQEVKATKQSGPDPGHGPKDKKTPTPSP